MTENRRNYWLFFSSLIALVFVCICCSVPSIAQNEFLGSHDGSKVKRYSDRRTQHYDNKATSPILPINVTHGKNSIEADCGTAKECRAEQREKDDLETQKVVAAAAVSQRNAAWWQTGVGAAGVILLILTVIYTHLATRAAIDAVRVVTVLEGAKPSIGGEDACTSDGEISHFRLCLSNTGRTVGYLTETCIQGSNTGLYKDFVAINPIKHNSVMPADNSNSIFSELKFPDKEYKFIVGYYTIKNVFSNKPLRDYFCFELSDVEGPPDANGRIAGMRRMRFRVDLDWPQDETA